MLSIAVRQFEDSRSKETTLQQKCNRSLFAQLIPLFSYFNLASI